MLQAKVVKFTKQFNPDGSTKDFEVKVKMTDEAAADPNTVTFLVSCNGTDPATCPVCTYVAGDKTLALAAIKDQTRERYNDWIKAYPKQVTPPADVVFKTDAEIVTELGTSTIA